MTTELLILSSRRYELSNGVSVGYHWQRKEEERLRQYKCLFLNASPIHENMDVPKSFFSRLLLYKVCILFVQQSKKLIIIYIASSGEVKNKYNPTLNPQIIG